MDEQLKAQLESLGILPAAMYTLPPGFEVHRSPRTNLPQDLKQILDRAEASAEALYDMEKQGEASTPRYTVLESSLRQDIAQLNSHRHGKFWVYPPSRVTGVAGINRDPFGDG